MDAYAKTGLTAKCYANLSVMKDEKSLPPEGPGEGLNRLVEIMAKLRAPGGCPWDREQTFASIKPYLLEETYEVMDAIDAQDWRGLADELGDLMLQAAFFAQMAQEAGHFDIRDSLRAINEKLVRRHPHVFGDGDAKTAEAVVKRWDEIKAEEKKSENRPAAKSILDGVPRSLPALMEAQKVTQKAAGVGFDWETFQQVTGKLHEELKELEAAQLEGTQGGVENEVGDLLFVVVNMARFLKVDPEQALRKTNAKFRRRFGYIEAVLAENGSHVKDATVDEMEELWQQAKARGL